MQPSNAESGSPDSQAVGEQVLDEAVSAAQGTWGARLVAAYALGSLAHGGFSAYVSDIDLGLVLSDPLESGDAQAVAMLANAATANGAPLADRLSIFWGSVATLSGVATGGRFPPLDRLDLLQYGRLLFGQDVHGRLAVPTQRELIVAGAQFALQSLASAEVAAEPRNPAVLVARGVRPLTKRVLFPVRFLYTARTGQVGRNEAAVDAFTTAERGPAADLARAAYRWRTEPPRSDDPVVIDLLARGLLPLYRIFVEEYAQQLRLYGEADLAQAFEDWRGRLS